MKMVHTPANGKLRATHPYTVFDLYAQSISLNKVNFFGLGNNSTLPGKSLFGISETIMGVSAIKPVFELKAIHWLNLALQGEVNGRVLSPSHGEKVAHGHFHRWLFLIVPVHAKDREAPGACRSHPNVLWQERPS
jgi:hypothetical protein